MIQIRERWTDYMSADIEYGWGKLMSEIQTKCLYQSIWNKGMSGEICYCLWPARKRVTRNYCVNIQSNTE